MTERPILFSAPMVRALLAGTKTQTRRNITRGFQDGRRPIGWGSAENGDSPTALRCPHGKAGDRLWVRETWGLHAPSDSTDWYRGKIAKLTEEHRAHWEVGRRADWQVEDGSQFWRPSIFMPRWASRLTLEVTGVRVERLQDISEADALAEGVLPYIHESWTVWDRACEAHVSLNVEPDAATLAKYGYEDVRHIGPKVIATAKQAYERLWDSINGVGAWAKNPWVWAITFQR